MNITITEAHDQIVWEKFIDSHAVTTFMQSWAWGEFEHGCGHQVYRFAILDDDRIIALVQTILIQSKRGTFLFIPHGPIVDSTILPSTSWLDPSKLANLAVVEEIIITMTSFLRNFAQHKGCSFIRLNSSLPNNEQLLKLLHGIGYRQAPIYLTSENGAVLSLHNKTETELLSQMRKTTRYLIHKAQKADIHITVDNKGTTIKDFMDLYSATTIRERFVGFNEEYIIKEFEAFQKYDNASIVTVYQDQLPLASAIILFTKNAAFYHQGASNHPKVPAPYILQWKALQLAIERHCLYYNFWGTYIPNRTPKSWEGLSLFKYGFGSVSWQYLPTHDLILKPSYYLTNLYEHYIRLKRGI